MIETKRLLLREFMEADDDIKSLNECEWHEKGDSDLYEYVRQSKAYQAHKERTYSKISVWVDET